MALFSDLFVDLRWRSRITIALTLLTTELIRIPLSSELHLVSVTSKMASPLHQGERLVTK